MTIKKVEYLKDGIGYIDITLAGSLDVDGAKVNSVRMREPTVSDQEASSEMNGSDAAREIAMFANLCQLSPADIRKLTLRDYKRLQTAFLGFMD